MSASPAPLPLPARPAPVPGEAFTGYLLRVADFYGTTLLSVIDELGLAEGRRPTVAPRLIEDLPTEMRGRVAARLRLDPDLIADMSVSSVERAIGPAGDGVMSAHAWRYRHHTPYCPACMEEAPGVWQLAWQWPYAAVCARHGVALVGECPGCNRRPFLRWGKGATRAGKLVALGRCMNAAPGASPKGADICGFNLSAARPVEASPMDVASRLVIDAAMAGMPIRCRHGVSSAGDFLADVRGACLLAVIGRGAVDLEGSSPALQRAASTGVQRRHTQGEPVYVVKNYPPGPVEVAGLVTMAVKLFVPLEEHPGGRQ